MKTNPPFTRLRFCERGPLATSLDGALRTQFRGDDRYRLVHGDCNVTIDATLVELAPFRRALTFAFIDQQAAEVHWETIKKSRPSVRTPKTARPRYGCCCLPL
jgi:hypothetical protein